MNTNHPHPNKRHPLIPIISLLLVLLAACSTAPLAEAPTPTPVQLFVPATAEPTPTPTLTPTLKPTSAPVPTPAVPTPTLTPTPDPLAPPTGRVIHGGNLRNMPAVTDDTIIGHICPTDEITFLDQQAEWFHVQIVRRGKDCSPLRVATGTHGWVHRSLLSTPPAAVAPGSEEDGAALATTPGISETIATEPPRDLVPGDVGYVDHPHGGNLRTAPYVAPDTVIGQICPGDKVEFLEEQLSDETLWYRVRVTDLAENCTQDRVAFNTEGWVSHLLLSNPLPAETVVQDSPQQSAGTMVRTDDVLTTTCETGNSGVFGINSHIASRYKDDTSLHTPVNMVVESGATWVREDFQWYRVEEAPDQYDWTYTDLTVDLMVERGINVVGVFNSAVGWATPYDGDELDDISFHPPDLDLFATFVYETVSRYRGRICYWEIWNEPEHPYFWHPQPDPAAYAAMLKAVYPAIKAADPNARVLMGGTVPFGLRFLRTIADYGAWDSFDILSLHPFIDPITPEEGQIGINGVQEVTTLFDQHGAKPIWVTEYGWASGPGDHNQGMGVDEETQANYLVRAGVLLHAAGAERVFWYTLKDTELRNGEPFNQYGLLHYGDHIDDYSKRKPALAALRTLNQQITNTQVIGVQDVGDRRVILDFEACPVWQIINPQHGSIEQSAEHSSNGTFAAALSYNFPPPGGSYVAFAPAPPLELPGSPNQLGMWVYGDGSGHALLVQLEDAEGEKLQYRLGIVGAEGWQFLVATLTGEVQPGHQISGPGSGNLRLDYPARLSAIVLGDETEGRNPTGTIYLDDLTVVSGSEAYVVRFARKGSNQVVDVLWSPEGAQVILPTLSERGTLVDRNGEEMVLAAGGGQFVINLGPSPYYFTHVPARAPPTVQG